MDGMYNLWTWLKRHGLSIAFVGISMALILPHKGAWLCVVVPLFLVLELIRCKGMLRLDFDSPDGKRVAFASDNTIRIKDAIADKQNGKLLEGKTDGIMAVAFSSDGESVITLSKDNTVRKWDVATGIQTGKPSESHIDCADWIGPASFSPDGRHIVSELSDGTLRIWDVATGRQVGDSLKVEFFNVIDETDKRNKRCQCVSFSPDGACVAWGVNTGRVFKWNVVTGRDVGAHNMGFVWGVKAVAFNPDGKRIVSGTDINTICIWDAATCDLIGESWEGHTDDVTAVAYSPDGKYIVSGSKDSTIRIWDVASGKQIGRPFAEHISPVNYVAFSPDGKRTLSKSEDGTVRIWDFPSLQDLINETRKRFKDCDRRSGRIFIWNRQQARARHGHVLLSRWRLAERHRREDGLQ